MSAAALLNEAEAVLAQRDGAYGPAAGAMAAIAARWSITLGQRVSPAQVVLCMIDLKLTRLAHDPNHHDSAVDVAGYAALLSEVIQ
jgi:Domain of unknown function (DUF6378)